MLRFINTIDEAAHILQVSNGKGRDCQSAARGALHEAAELWAAEQPLLEALEASAGHRGELPAGGSRAERHPRGEARVPR